MDLIGGVIFFRGLLGILLNRRHILILLLCLEFIYLGILYCIFIEISIEWGGLNLIIYIFLIVCEAGLGLAILVKIVYYYGDDKVNSIILLKC